eukprot:CAMPEP_0197826434 /NCGR_PEP_ID=MMETSP1437-20131217/3396_1 /TAXON_ID=49252 ORGANISM="Eucampia antarctica, Strain CCMP1452" /NCGR_SAMPLE_ID=MMETSP1437 /ASSEMBLY_ACC=CAM_ASM_001096 /LENGTH=329 /DNA_ID=CAMNT_0043426873 /DNA_START=73 /DNA_END=1062 /DNA_ORIENTATION=+
MKVFIHYEDNKDTELHKSLKLTLPKSWKNGSVSKILSQFVETYNSNDRFGAKNPLIESELHLGTEVEGDNDDNTNHKTNMDSLVEEVPSSPCKKIKALASNAITIEVLNDRDSIYVCHGPSQTVEEVLALQKKKEDEHKQKLASTVACVRFGCQKRFPKEGPYPENCTHHKSPPVFHETAKFWSCCPLKKAYDWDEFQSIPGCCTADACSHVKEEKDENEKSFLGGCDMRIQNKDNAPKLKTIDDFNSNNDENSKSDSVLDRFQSVMNELDIENELIFQVFAGMKKEAGMLSVEEENDPAKTKLLQELLAKKMKTALKSIAAEQLRIKP